MTDMPKLRTFCVVINWADKDREQGDFGAMVRASSPEDAEARAREEMSTCYSGDFPELYINEDGTFGGSLVSCDEGAIWKAADLEAALRGLLARADEHASRAEWSDNGERDRARKLLAEIDQDTSDAPQSEHEGPANG